MPFSFHQKKNKATATVKAQILDIQYNIKAMVSCNDKEE